QAAAATVEPGTIVRLYASAGSASDPLDNYLGDNSPVYEVYAANRSAVNPLALGTTVMTLNRGANGAGGMLINDNASRTYGSVPNGMIAIGTNGGVIAATRYTTLTVSQPIALDTNELVIGSTETFDWVSEPKLGTVLLSASMGASTAGKGSRITVLPDVELRNGAHSLPDLAEVDVGGVFYLAGADTIGALSGTGLVTVASTLTVGCNDADATFSGVLTGASGLYKTGAGRLDLTGDQSTFTGTVRVNGGELALSGNGRLNNTGTAAYTLAENGVLHLDNSENNLTNRLTGAAPRVTFNGGTFRLTGQDGAAAGETVENAVFASGDSTIEIINGTGAGSSTELIFASFTGNPAGTVNFIGSNGTLGEPGDNPRVKFNGLAAGLVACGRVGEHLAIYDTVNGIKAFTLPEGTEFDGTVSQSGINTVFTSANVSPTMTAARSVNSLWISNPGSGKSLSLGTFNLTVTSGRILLAGTDDFSITRAGSGILTCTPTYLFLGVDDKDTTLTLGVPTDKAIAKEGAGTLIIDSVCTFTGGLVINDGTVTYGAGGDLAATSLQTWNDGLLDLAGKSDTLGALTLYAGGITNSDESVESTLAIGALTMGSGPVGSSAFVDVGTNGTLKLGGTVTYNVVNDPNTAYIRGKALDLNVAAGSSRTFTVNDSVAPSAYIDLDISAAIGGVANAGITKGGTGTLRLSGANTFDGPLNITGTLRLAHPQAHGLPSTTRAMTINNGYSLVLDNANGNI
ncbi:MAG: hypothetical protein GX748_14225, partial [Lentisphaerae bacterium]|nr:hypothetical protein [Lentisphaerota bacterium]